MEPQPQLLWVVRLEKLFNRWKEVEKHWTKLKKRSTIGWVNWKGRKGFTFLDTVKFRKAKFIEKIRARCIIRQPGE